MAQEIKTAEEFQEYKDLIKRELEGAGFGISRFSEGNDFKVNFIHAYQVQQKFVFKPVSLELVEEAGQEGSILETCKHPNIIKHTNDEIGESLYFIGYEPVENTLYEYFTAENKKLQHSVLGKIAKQLIRAIEYLHKNNLYLKDISLRSILLDDKHNIKITNVCEERSVSKRAAKKAFLRSENDDVEQIFYPPELLEQDNQDMEIEENNNSAKWNDKADIWAFAMILYTLYGGSQKHIVDFTKVESDLDDLETLQEELYFTIIQILSREPKDRLGIEEIKAALDEFYGKDQEAEVQPDGEDSENDKMEVQDENKDNNPTDLFKMLGLNMGGGSIGGAAGAGGNKFQTFQQNPFSSFNPAASRSDFGGSSFSQQFGVPNTMPHQPIRSYKRTEPEPEIILNDQELNTDPTTSDGWYRRGMHFKNKKDFNQAIKCFKESIKEDGKKTEAYVQLGLTYKDCKDSQQLSEGFKYFEDLEKKDPKCDMAISEQGKMQYFLKDYEKAIDLFNKASDMNENNKTFFSYFASAYNNVGKHDFAIFYCRQGQKADPHDWFAPYNLGYAYLKKKKPDVCIQFMNEAYEIESNLETNLAMGNAHQDKEEYSKAIEYYKIAIERDPNSDLPYFYLGQVSEKQNDKNQAINYFRKACELNSTNNLARQQLEELLKK